MTLWVSSTEPGTLQALGTPSTLPESYGVDFLWHSRVLPGLVGVQRKEFSDFVASVQDGRLAKEIAQMGRLALAVLVIEGRPRWTTDGQLVHGWARWSQSAHRAYLLSVQARGVYVVGTDTLTETIAAVLDVRRWADKPHHRSLDSRPKPTGKWGTPTERDYALHLLQSVPGLGPGRAEAVLAHFGRAPLGWTCTREDLLAVPGLGPKLVDKMWKAMGGTESTENESKGAGDDGAAATGAA